MSDPPSVPPSGEAGVEEHTHHWLIANQDGPSSPAVCKDCGEQRDFSNSFVQRKPPWAPRPGAARRNPPEEDPDGGEP